MTIPEFKKTIWKYYAAHKRPMPWRTPSVSMRRDGSVDAYKVVVSEIMLQQTQVDRVKTKYAQFLKLFPNFKSLAAASPARVLRAWNGLGYNRRALYVHRIAQKVIGEYRGALPRDPKVLETFPGIGQATAGSLCAFAFNMPVAFIETNIRRVFIHFFFKNRKRVRDTDLLPLVHKTVPDKNPREWYYALMDYGAYLAQTLENPNKKSAHYAKQKKFEGSDRQARGMVMKLLAGRSSVPLAPLRISLKADTVRFERILRSLEKDNMITRTKESVYYKEA